VSPSRDDEESFDFEGALTELEEITGRLDRQDIGLDEAIALFERGIARLAAANRWLDRAAGRVEELIETSSGKLATRPLEPAPGGSDDAAG